MSFAPFCLRRFLPAALTLSALLAGTSCLLAQSSITSGRVYTLISQTSNLSVDNSGSTTPGTAVTQAPAGAGNTNQQWQINSTGNGNYQMICLASGMALSNSDSSANRAPIVQSVPSASDAGQQWKFSSIGDGYYQITSSSGGMALDNSGSTVNGGTVWQSAPVSGDANQIWQIVPVQIGAITPFTSYEAEGGTLNGGAAVVSLGSSPTTEFSNPALEASGHSYVHLGAKGQSIAWTNNTGHAITAINIRYSVPDAPTGGGIRSTLDLLVNGTFRQALNVNSVQTWVYESSSNYNGMSEDPSQGTPHVFWDEVHAFISGAPVAPGDTVTLQLDPANSAAYYNIDVIDLEAPPAPLAQPANSLSLTADCGAVANSTGTDSTSAIQNCFNQAQSQGKSVWIPQGTFYLNTPSGLNVPAITVQGAGMWYSTIYYNPPLPTTVTNDILRSTSSVLKNFAIDGNAVDRSSTGGSGGGININGTNWLVDSLWIQHENAAVWGDGTSGTVQNCRINNSWADGINLNNGNGQPGNGTGNNLTAKNNFVRGTGDDGLAINDNSAATEMNNTTLIDNTVVAPWWSNNIGVYGGQNGLVANNLLTDSVKQYGVSIGIFTSNGGALQSVAVQGNLVKRGGSFGYGYEHAGIGVGVTGPESAIGNVILNGNTIVDPLFDGVDVSFVANASVNNNLVQSPNLTGFAIIPTANGSASFVCNTVTGLASGQQAYVDSASGFQVSGICNSGFSVSMARTMPTVAMSASSNITTAQSLAVTVMVAGASSQPVPTGSIELVSGSYSSGSTLLTNGSAAISISPGTLGSGSFTLAATYTPDSAGRSLYTSSVGTISVNIAVPLPGFTLSNGGAIAISSGATTASSTTITLTPTNGFTGPVNLSCAVTTSIPNPTDIPTCGVPASINATNSGAMATLTVNTTASSRTSYRKRVGSSGAALLAMIGFSIPVLRRRRRVTFALLVFGVLGVGTGCGGGSGASATSGAPVTALPPVAAGGTTVGAYVVTVTASSGTIAQSTAVNLTVN